MLQFPEVQRKAQEELDRVLEGRLPEFTDEENLPYISAIIKEVLRCVGFNLKLNYLILILRQTDGSQLHL